MDFTWFVILTLLGCLRAVFSTTDLVEEAAYGPQEIFAIFICACNDKLKFQGKHVMNFYCEFLRLKHTHNSLSKKKKNLSI